MASPRNQLAHNSWLLYTQFLLLSFIFLISVNVADGLGHLVFCFNFFLVRMIFFLYNILSLNSLPRLES